MCLKSKARVVDLNRKVICDAVAAYGGAHRYLACSNLLNLRRTRSKQPRAAGRPWPSLTEDDDTKRLSYSPNDRSEPTCEGFGISYVPLDAAWQSRGGLNRPLLYLWLTQCSTTKPFFSLKTESPKRSSDHATDHDAPFAVADRDCDLT